MSKGNVSMLFRPKKEKAKAKAIAIDSFEYENLIDSYGKKGVSFLQELPIREQIVLSSLYLLTLDNHTKAEIFYADDDFPQISKFLTYLASKEITPRKFGMWAKRRFITLCQHHIDIDLERSYSKYHVYDYSADDLEQDRIDRAKDLIRATR